MTRMFSIGATEMAAGDGVLTDVAYICSPGGAGEGGDRGTPTRSGCSRASRSSGKTSTPLRARALGEPVRAQPYRARRRRDGGARRADQHGQRLRSRALRFRATALPGAEGGAVTEAAGEVRLENGQTAGDAVACPRRSPAPTGTRRLRCSRRLNHVSSKRRVELVVAALRHRGLTVIRGGGPGSCARWAALRAPPVGESGLPEAPLEGLTAGTVRGAGLLRARLPVDPRVPRWCPVASEVAGAIDHAFMCTWRRACRINWQRIPYPRRRGGPRSRSTGPRRRPSAGSGCEAEGECCSPNGPVPGRDPRPLQRARTAGDRRGLPRHPAGALGQQVHPTAGLGQHQR